MSSSKQLATILVVDDNDPVRYATSHFVRGAGFQVCIATTAAGALAIVRTLNERIGVIVTDHLMPGSSGADLVRQLRQSGLSHPVIVLSGLAEAVGEYDGLDVIFRTKPLPPAELIELVRSALAGPSRQGNAA